MKLTSPLCSYLYRLLNRLRKPQNTEEEDDEESQGTKEMKISKESEGDETFAEVVGGCVISALKIQFFFF